MAIVRCPKGHYYDDKRFSHCPHCGFTDNINVDFSGEAPTQSYYEDSDDDSRTIAIDRNGSGHEDAEDHTIALTGFGDDLDDGKTIGAYSAAKGNDYVTGWIVCVDGPEMGRDYRLHHGFNRAGRSPMLDVVIAEDPRISLENHFSIVYDNKHNQFSLVPVGGNLLYMDGVNVTTPKTLETGNTFTAGNSTFEFVAFCRGERVWEKE